MSGTFKKALFLRIKSTESKQILEAKNKDVVILKARISPGENIPLTFEAVNENHEFAFEPLDKNRTDEIEQEIRTEVRHIEERILKHRGKEIVDAFRDGYLRKAVAYGQENRISDSCVKMERWLSNSNTQLETQKCNYKVILGEKGALVYSGFDQYSSAYLFSFSSGNKMTIPPIVFLRKEGKWMMSL